MILLHHLRKSIDSYAPEKTSIHHSCGLIRHNPGFCRGHFCGRHRCGYGQLGHFPLPGQFQGLPDHSHPLSAKFLPQKNQIINAIKKSNGSGLTIQNEAIISADVYLKNQGIETSLEGSLAFSGYQKAIKNNFDVGQFPVILLTGAKR